MVSFAKRPLNIEAVSEMFTFKFSADVALVVSLATSEAISFIRFDKEAVSRANLLFNIAAVSEYFTPETAFR